jgi:hypothetical protein
MSELKADLDLSYLLSAGFLRQCGFDRNQVALLFERMEIDIRSPCEIISPDGRTCFFETGKTYDMTVFTYPIDSEITAYRIVPGQKLILRFSNSSHWS